jgi:hypothetical protein
MTQQTINVGTNPNDGTGDSLRVAMQKTQANFTDLYGGAGGAAGGGLPVVGHIASRWYAFKDQATGAAGNVVTLGTMYATLVRVSEKLTIDHLSAKVSTISAAGNFQLALYAVGNKTPTGLPLAYTGSISTGSATAPTTGTLTGGSLVSAGKAQLPIGWYWLVLNCDNSVAAFIAASGAQTIMSSEYGASAAAQAIGSSAIVNSVTSPQTFGAWPDVSAAPWTDQTGSFGVLGAFFTASVP